MQSQSVGLVYDLVSLERIQVFTYLFDLAAAQECNDCSQITFKSTKMIEEKT